MTLDGLCTKVQEYVETYNKQLSDSECSDVGKNWEYSYNNRCYTSSGHDHQRDGRLWICEIQVLSVAIVQLPLRDNMYGVPWDLVSAMGWIILWPIIIFAAVFEKQIMDGIMAGGVRA